MEITEKLDLKEIFKEVDEQTITINLWQYSKAAGKAYIKIIKEIEFDKDDEYNFFMMFTAVQGAICEELFKNEEENYA